MNWVLFGAAGAAISKDPQASERMLSMLVYLVCFILPVVPIVFVCAKKRAYEAVRSLGWAKRSMAVTALLGITGLMVIGVLLQMTETTLPALLTANSSMVAGLIIIRYAEKKCGSISYDLEELVSKITPENKHGFSDTDFGDPVGREKL